MRPGERCAFGVVGLLGRDDGLVLAGAYIAALTLVAAPIDGVAQVERRPPDDVLHALLRPGPAATLDAFGPKVDGNLAVANVAGTVGIENAPDQLGLRLHDCEPVRADDVVLVIADDGIPERVGAVVLPALVLGARDADHTLAVHVGLELRGLAELPEQEPAYGRIEAAIGEVGDDESQIAPVQLVLEVQHKPGIAG
jgi:hypothetical protein